MHQVNNGGGAPRQLPRTRACIGRRHGLVRPKTACALLACLTAVALLIGGCTTISSANGGTGGAMSTTGSTATPASLSAPLEAALASGYQGISVRPTSTGPRAVTGKNVWVISCGQVYPACVLLTSEIQQAGKALGWKVTVADGKADPTIASTAINQAIAAKADGIVVFDYDCPTIKSALLNARAAKIPVVQQGSFDCSAAAYGGGQSLFTASLNMMDSTDTGVYYSKYGAARADFLAAEIGGKGTVLSYEETSYLQSQAENKGFNDEFAKVCPRCTLIKVPWAFSQVGTTASQTWLAALEEHPNVQAVAFGYDSMMGLGLQSDLEQVGFKGIVAGAEGLNLDLVRSGAQTTEVALPYALQAWGTADTLNRIFAGANPSTLPSEGGGWLFVDKDHNMPATGASVPVPYDFQAIYTKMWSGK